MRVAVQGVVLPGGFKLWVLPFMLVVLIQVSSLLAMPIVYDTKHLPDTLFLLNEAWRVHLGLRPGVDFESFYPGLAARFVALSFALFGPSVRAIDVAPLLQLLVILPLTLVVLHHRCGRFAAMATLALMTTCLLTRAPLEQDAALNDMLSAHSFSYNRLGLACSLILLFLVLLPSKSGRRGEILAGAAGGVALAMALLSKWSFVLLLPTVLLALALQRRLAAITALVTAAFLCCMYLDPLGQQFIGAATYMAATARVESMFGGVGAAAYKAILLVVWQLSALLVLCIILMIVVRKLPIRARWVWLGSAALMCVAIGGTLVVMGTFNVVGHQLLPVIAALAIASVEQDEEGDSKSISAPKLSAGLLVLMFVLPHLTNSILVTAAGYKNRTIALISEGPMKGYLQRHGFGRMTRDEVLSKGTEKVARSGVITPDTQYPIFVDGVMALRRLGDLSNTGIVSDGLFNFEFASGSRPVLKYPLWARISSPEMSRSEQIPNEADVVMLLRHGDSSLSGLLRARMGDDFRFCMNTEMWELFSRRSKVLPGCN